MEFAENVAKELGVTNCYVCGGTNMGEAWPWEALEADGKIFNNLTQQGNITKREIQAMGTLWALTTSLVGKECYKQNNTNGVYVGDLMCLGYWENGKWYSSENLTEPEQHNFLNILQNGTNSNWTTPQNMYWICGNTAYEYLPANWSGTCMIGWIKPSFFLIPLQNERKLGVPIYDTWKPERIKRNVNTYLGTGIGGISTGKWGEDWPPERIIQYYDPATWAEDGSWGYRTPIYLINRLIRLQAVMEIAGNRIDAVLNIISKEQDKLRTAVYQNRLALDYLLAAEGGVCGKFNLTNCCLQINPVGKVVADLTADLRKIVHVPVQTWHGLTSEDGIFGGIFSNWKQALFMGGLILCGIIMLPCIIPLIRSIVQSSIEGILSTQQSKSIMMMKENGDQLSLIKEK